MLEALAGLYPGPGYKPGSLDGGSCWQPDFEKAALASGFFESRIVENQLAGHLSRCSFFLERAIVLEA